MYYLSEQEFLQLTEKIQLETKREILINDIISTATRYSNECEYYLDNTDDEQLLHAEVWGFRELIDKISQLKKLMGGSYGKENQSSEDD